MVDSIYTFVEQDNEPIEKELICHICSGSIEVIPGNSKDQVILYCSKCDEELARLISIERMHLELKKTYEKALKRLEHYSDLYNQLQDHLKALLY